MEDTTLDRGSDQPIDVSLTPSGLRACSKGRQRIDWTNLQEDGFAVHCNTECPECLTLYGDHDAETGACPTVTIERLGVQRMTERDLDEARARAEAERLQLAHNAAERASIDAGAKALADFLESGAEDGSAPRLLGYVAADGSTIPAGPPCTCDAGEDRPHLESCPARPRPALRLVKGGAR
jgi:hypothetical protein